MFDFNELRREVDRCVVEGLHDQAIKILQTHQLGVQLTSRICLDATINNRTAWLRRLAYELPGILDSKHLEERPEPRKDVLLEFAAKYGNPECVRLLVEEYGADVNAGFAGTERVVLNGACNNGHALIVQYLLGRGANPNSTANDCLACYGLMHAATKGFPEIAKLLVEHGGLINAPNAFGMTPLAYCTGAMLATVPNPSEAGKRAVYEYLRSVGAKLPVELATVPPPPPPDPAPKPKSRKRK